MVTNVLSDAEGPCEMVRTELKMALNLRPAGDSPSPSIVNGLDSGCFE